MRDIATWMKKVVFKFGFKLLMMLPLCLVCEFHTVILQLKRTAML